MKGRRKCPREIRLGEAGKGRRNAQEREREAGDLEAGGSQPAPSQGGKNLLEVRFVGPHNLAFRRPGAVGPAKPAAAKPWHHHGPFRGVGGAAHGGVGGSDQGGL